MKMLLLKYLTAVVCAVFIATGAVSGVDVFKAVGDQVSFHPDKFEPPVTSIIWKHRNTGGYVDKAIVWEEGSTETWIPIQRFRDITTLDEKTGQITIINLTVEHSGVYIIDINSKEQEQRFTLTVMDRVPKPEVEEIKDNPDVVYLRCKYSEKNTWKKSAGEELTGSKLSPTGQSITVKNEENPVNFYTCTLDNGASKETSDLFKDGSGKGWWIVNVFTLIVLATISCILFFLNKITVKILKCFDDLCLLIKANTERQQYNTAKCNDTVMNGAEESMPLQEENEKGEEVEEKERKEKQ